MSTGGAYARTLAVPGARRLLVSSIVGRLPLGMSLAVLLLVHDATGSFADAGAVVGALGLAAAVIGPVLGRLVDRLGQLPVLAVAAVAQAAVLVALVVATLGDAGVVALAALGALAGATTPPIAACLRTLWPRLAPDPVAREAAFALDATVQEVIWTSGPLLVGVVVAFASPAAAVLGMAAVVLVGTAWFASAPLARAWRAAGSRRGGVLRGAGMRVVLLSAVAAGLSMGTLEVGLPVVAEELGAPGATGPLLALTSFGSLVGGLAYGARAWRTPLSRRAALLLVAAAALVTPLALAGSVGVAFVLAFAAGTAWAPVLACSYALVGRLAPPGAVAEAFTWSGSAIVGGIALGIAAGGALAAEGGAAATFVFGGVAALAAALVAHLGRHVLAAGDDAPEPPAVTEVAEAVTSA